MRTYVSPIGYNSTSVARPVVLSRGVNDGDAIVLLRPDVPNDPRAEEAIADIEGLLREIELDVSLTIEQIDHESFETAILECSEIIQAAKGECFINLAGGARDVFLPFACAALAHTPLVDTVLFFSDIDGTVVELQLPRLTADVPDTTRTTLSAIADDDNAVSVPELTDATGQSKSTVTRHVNHLADQDIVETWKEGKTKHVRITLTGKLFHQTST